MVAFLGLIGPIISAISGAAELFDTGKQIFEGISGKPSAARTPQDLQNEVEALPADQGQAWIYQMDARVRQYEAENERLRLQGGELDPETFRVLGNVTASKIALMRMTTRPWAIRWMVRALVAPPLFIIFTDGLTMLVQNIAAAAGHPFTMTLMIDRIQSDAGSAYMEIYGMLVNPATATVIAYLTLRQYQKTKEIAGGRAGGGIGDSIRKIVGLFRK